MKRIVFALLGFVAPVAAAAHALPQSETPAAGSTLAAAPAEVVIIFSEPLEGHFSSLQVTDAAGVSYVSGPAQVAKDDAKRFSVSLKPLPSGTYKVIWHATSVDTHKTEGSYQFVVGH